MSMATRPSILLAATSLGPADSPSVYAFEGCREEVDVEINHPYLDLIDSSNDFSNDKF
jgi:hypothetical protein